MVRTLDTRRRDESHRKVEAVAVLSERLGRYARASGGRYLLYGSAARGSMRHDSDVDLLIDFPADAEAAAWRFAEEVCAAGGLAADIRPLAWCSDRFRDLIRPDLRVLA